MESLIVDALATHRLARLAVTDSIFDGPRARILGALHEAGYEKAKEVFRCVPCASVWCAFGVVAARWLAPRAWDPVARALAFSDVAVIVGSFTP